MELEISEQDIQDIIDYNKSINESDWWVKKDLLKSAFSSYYYYENILEQMCSIFRGLDKNHAFSNANKRTASMFLAYILKKYGYGISDDNLIDIVLDVAEHNYEIPEIALKLSKMIYEL
jgi:death-on-curing family protein